jgi:hypothetical protein
MADLTVFLSKSNTKEKKLRIGEQNIVFKFQIDDVREGDGNELIGKI